MKGKNHMSILLIATIALTILAFIISKKITAVKHTKIAKFFKILFFVIGIIGIISIIREVRYYSYIDNHLFLTCTTTLTNGSSKIVYVLDNNTYIKRDNIIDFKTFFHPVGFRYSYNLPDIRSLVDLTDNMRREEAKNSYTYSQSIDPYQENLDNILSLSDQDMSVKFLIDTPEGRTVSINRDIIDSYGSQNATEFFNEIESILMNEQ